MYQKENRIYEELKYTTEHEHMHMIQYWLDTFMLNLLSLS